MSFSSLLCLLCLAPALGDAEVDLKPGKRIRRSTLVEDFRILGEEPEDGPAGEPFDMPLVYLYTPVLFACQLSMYGTIGPLRKVLDGMGRPNHSGYLILLYGLGALWMTPVSIAMFSGFSPGVFMDKAANGSATQYLTIGMCLFLSALGYSGVSGEISGAMAGLVSQWSAVWTMVTDWVLFGTVYNLTNLVGVVLITFGVGYKGYRASQSAVMKPIGAVGIFFVAMLVICRVAPSFIFREVADSAKAEGAVVLEPLEAMAIGGPATALPLGILWWFLSNKVGVDETSDIFSICGGECLWRSLFFSIGAVLNMAGFYTLAGRYQAKVTEITNVFCANTVHFVVMYFIDQNPTTADTVAILACVAGGLVNAYA